MWTEPDGLLWALTLQPRRFTPRDDLLGDGGGRKERFVSPAPLVTRDILDGAPSPAQRFLSAPVLSQLNHKVGGSSAWPLELTRGPRFRTRECSGQGGETGHREKGCASGRPGQRTRRQTLPPERLPRLCHRSVRPRITAKLPPGSKSSGANSVNLPTSPILRGSVSLRGIHRPPGDH